SVGVPVDSPLTIDFNSGMNPATTAAAIHLDPPVPGTRVIPNSKDHSRFMVLPGHMLDAGGTYRLSVEGTATDLHGQALAAAATAVQTAIPGGSLPSWSPDGSTLAYQQGGSLWLYRPVDAITTQLPAGDPLLAPPVWGPAGELLVLNTVGAGGLDAGAHVELADTLVTARYPIP